MSRVDELKKQYPHLTLSFFDLLVRMDETKSKKYLAVLCKVFSKKWELKTNVSTEDYSEEILRFNTNLIAKGISTDNLNDTQIYLMTALSDFWNDDTYYTFKDFIYYIENKKIKNNDVTSYDNIDDIRSAISLAVMNEMDKEMQSQVIKEFEDETWVIVRPLTFAASAKYGASTRWCTTYHKEKNYFERYWRQGILVYFINKKTGYKFAGFKSTTDNELSFWNAEDQRVDFLTLKIDDYLLSTIRKIFESDKSNKNLCSDELQNQVHEECLDSNILRLSITDTEQRLYFHANGNVGIGIQQPNNEELAVNEIQENLVAENPEFFGRIPTMRA